MLSAVLLKKSPSCVSGRQASSEKWLFCNSMPRDIIFWKFPVLTIICSNKVHDQLSREALYNCTWKKVVFGDLLCNVYIEEWKRKRSKCIQVKKNLDLFRSHPSILTRRQNMANHDFIKTTEMHEIKNTWWRMQICTGICKWNMQEYVHV